METKIFETPDIIHPKLYLRYIDDIFAVFDDETSCSRFLALLNSKHKNIKFTVEKAQETIPFLDVEIKINDKYFDTWVWRKPTNTGLCLNFNSVCPSKWKSGLILCLLSRAREICSSNLLLNEEINKLKNMFYANNYPT